MNMVFSEFRIGGCGMWFNVSRFGWRQEYLDRYLKKISS